MVLGLRTKSKKGSSVQVDYLVHVEEIKPWPPSQSLRSLRSVLLQWENGDRCSGSTNPIVPSLGSGTGDGKIEFNESFRLPVTLSRELSVKGGDSDAFQKNCLEFNLYEPRRDKTVKGQLLGTVIVDLADHGIIKDTMSISAPMNCKRSFRNTAQPVLFLKIQPFDKVNLNSSSSASLSKEASLDKDGKESVSALMNEEYAEEAEVASFTDDDISSHSSLTMNSSTIEAAGCSPSQSVENGSEKGEDSEGRCNSETALACEQVPKRPELKPITAAYKHLNGVSSHLSSIDISSDIGSPLNDNLSLSNFHERNLILNHEEYDTQSVQSASSSMVKEGTGEQLRNNTRNIDQDNLALAVHEKVANGINENGKIAQKATTKFITDSLAAEVASSDSIIPVGEKSELANYADMPVIAEDNAQERRNSSEEAACSNSLASGVMVDNDSKKQHTNGQEEQILQENKHSTEDGSLNQLSHDASRSQVALGSNTHTLKTRALGSKGNTLTYERLKHVKSVRSPMDTARSNGSASDNQSVVDGNEHDFVEQDAHNGARSFITNGRKETKAFSRDMRNSLSDTKIQQLEHRIEALEGELREAAALEVSLYSIVAEHGSSTNKVHAPARRLSRIYLHACKDKSPKRRGSAARSAVSGLVLVAKACGNDVPRLTFWLSNSVVLRAIVSQAVENLRLPLFAGPHFETIIGGKRNGKSSSPLKWKQSSPGRKEDNTGVTEYFDDWEDPHTFINALEKCEAWIFSRLVESVWWQTLTPHMQSTAAKASDGDIVSSSRNTNRRRSSLGEKEQERFSLDLWKKAFKDAFEKLCPVRAGGHECGCLPVLARLVMEHCVGRLDVAMFNAILRESDDEIPTDPVSDPIGDSKILPIPAGKSSFGAGAQLKNSIGNWSRWLTDLFGIDYDDSPDDKNELDENDRQESETSFKAFHLLNALSDLLMLPKDMLLNSSIRKEVCPTFGAPLIKKILCHFVPDEFCPDPVPEVVLEALNSKDALEDEEETITNFPCIAAPTVYSPPSAASLADIIGEVGSESQLNRSGSTVLRKSYTSDDELDELDSPLTSIILDSFRYHPTSTPNLTPKVNGGPNVLRYQFLRGVWKDSD